MIRALIPEGVESIMCRVIRAVEKVLETLGDEAGGREGGVFRFYQVVEYAGAKMPVELLSCVVGQIPPEKYNKYARLSDEKAQRLCCLGLAEGHVSSYQSRQPDQEQYGGAVAFVTVASEVKGDSGRHPYIVRFSGLPELGDEAAMALVGTSFLTTIGSETQLKAIADASNNNLLRRLLEAEAS